MALNPEIKFEVKTDDSEVINLVFDYIFDLIVTEENTH